jgi:Tol biopolymer transport system component
MTRSGPRISPDGTRVAFAAYSDTWTLKVASLIDQSITVLTDRMGASVPAWTSDDRLFFQGSGGLWSIRADGSGLGQATFADSAETGETHGRPFVLPGDRGVLHTNNRTRDLGVLDLETGETTSLGVRGTYPLYSSSGHLLYAGVESGTFFAVPFDLGRLQISGEPIRLPFAPRRGFFGSLDAAVSGDGTLVYVSTEAERRETVWVSRGGDVSPVGPDQAGALVWPRVHPDGLSIMGISNSDGDRIAAVVPLNGGPLRRVGYDVRFGENPEWHPDGSSVSMVDNGVPLVVPLDGRASVPVIEGFDVSEATWSPDGRWLILVSNARTPERYQLYLLAAQGDSIPRILIGSDQSERGPAVSPDGRYLAYTHGNGSDTEVVVRPFPGVEQGRVQVSLGGGSSPTWSKDGRELFFRDAAGGMVAAQIETSEGFDVVGVDQLLAGSGFDLSRDARRYDVHPDGQRFVMERRVGAELVLVLNWFEELRSLFDGG